MEMPGRCVTPNVIMYNATISTCEKDGQWQQALELLMEMPGRGVTPNVITYNPTISACEKAGQ